MRSIATLATAAGTLLLLAAPAPAQVAGEVILFSQTNHRGHSFLVRGTRSSLVIPWNVRSVRVARGEAWDLCTRTNHREPCNRVAESLDNVNWRVASARPSRAVNLPAPVPPGGGANSGSLRGMSAEFFVAPQEGGRRVVSCASGAAACAEQSADRFCRARGWTAATYHRQETVRGTNYLTDILCTRTGR